MTDATAQVGFEVEDAGQPKLSPEGQEAATEPDAVSTALVVAGWTPEEAAAIFSALFNIGVMIWGPEWAAAPVEFRASGLMAVPMLDKYVPKAVGGPLQTGVGLIAVAGEIAGATARRYPLIKRGPRPVWAAKPNQPKQETSSSSAAAEAPAEAAATPASNGRSTYTIPKDLQRVIPPQTDETLGGMGYAL